MKQADLGLSLTAKRTRKREFLDEMNPVVPWAAFLDLVSRYAPEGKKRRPAFPLEAMLRMHYMQQWLTLSDLAMEEALHDTPLYREFAGLDDWQTRLPDESTILRFRHLLERHELTAKIPTAVNGQLRAKGLVLRAVTIVDATVITAPSSTKNACGERDPEMHQSKKGKQWYFGEAHISVDAQSELVHTVRGTAGNISDVVEANALLHGNETAVFTVAGCQGAHKHADAREGVACHVAMRPGNRAALVETRKVDRIINEIERLKASVRAGARQGSCRLVHAASGCMFDALE